MIDPSKLHHMHGGFRRRKLILTLGALERDIAGINDETLSETKTAFRNISRSDYLKKIVEIVCDDPKLSESARNTLVSLTQAESFDELRVCNTARNVLLEITGSPSAEWDLIIAPHRPCNESSSIIGERPFHKGLFIYAEDIRSPFNLGSIFRTAEAFGAEKLFLSPLCTDPAHPRAIRSAMGCIDFLPYERLSLDDLCAAMPDVPVFALETGGTPLTRFPFPKKGIAVIGSEELGINPDTLKKASYGTVTVPMCGVKASLNVGVAFGILMQAWTESLSALR